MSQAYLWCRSRRLRNGRVEASSPAESAVSVGSTSVGRSTNGCRPTTRDQVEIRRVEHRGDGMRSSRGNGSTKNWSVLSRTRAAPLEIAPDCENVQWLRRTNAPGAGRDTAFDRTVRGATHSSAFSGCSSDAKHWLSHCTAPTDVASAVTGLGTLETQPPPRVHPRHELSIHDSNAVRWIESHNALVDALRDRPTARIRSEAQGCCEPRRVRSSDASADLCGRARRGAVSLARKAREAQKTRTRSRPIDSLRYNAD